MDELGVTPYHMVKPRLEWIGKLLGMDVYVDTQQMNPRKRQLAQDLLEQLTRTREQ